MANFFNVVLVFLEQPKRSGRKQTTSMSSLINKKIRANDVSLPKPHPQVSSPHLSDLEQRIKLISRRLDERNVKGGIRLPASDDKIAPISFPEGWSHRPNTLHRSRELLRNDCSDTIVTTPNGL